MIRVGALVVAAAIAITGLAGRIVERASLWFWVWNVAAVALVAVQGLFGWWAIQSARRARDATKTVVADQLAPLSRRLSLLARACSAVRVELLGETLTAGVACASGLANSARVRATLFRRTTTEAGLDVFTPHTTLGRGDEPQSVFVLGIGSIEGDTVWRDANEDVSRFCRDVQRRPPPGWRASQHREYRTFITVPVRAGAELVGLLTVNAPRPGDLTVNDVGSMQVIAGMLGASLGMADLTWPASGG